MNSASGVPGLVAMKYSVGVEENEVVVEVAEDVVVVGTEIDELNELDEPDEPDAAQIARAIIAMIAMSHKYWTNAANRSLAFRLNVNALLRRITNSFLKKVSASSAASLPFVTTACPSIDNVVNSMDAAAATKDSDTVEDLACVL